MNIIKTALPLLVSHGLLLFSDGALYAETKSEIFTLEKVFDLEYASDSQISPDGSQVVFVRNFMDKMKDTRRSNLWIINSDGSNLRPLTTGKQNDFSPQWSPDGTQLVYASSQTGSTEIYRRWMDTGQTAQLTQLTETPAHLTWFWKPWFYEAHIPDIGITAVEKVGTDYWITLENHGGLPGPVDLTVTYADSSTADIHQTARIWEQGNTLYRFPVNADQELLSVELVEKQMVDMDSTNNHFVIP